MINNYLITLGLSQKQAAIYAFILENGICSPSLIAKTIKINRTTVYLIIESLIKIGLVVKKEKSLNYQVEACPPEKLKSIVEQKMEEEKKKVEALEKVFPYLHSMYTKTQDKPDVKYYKGLEEVKKAYHKTLESSSSIMSFIVLEEMDTLMPEFVEYYIAKRVEKKIPIYVITPDSPLARKIQKRDAVSYRNSIIIPKEETLFLPEINIFENTVMITSSREKYCITIENPEVARGFRSLFLIAWKGYGGKPIEKEEKEFCLDTEE